MTAKKTALALPDARTLAADLKERRDASGLLALIKAANDGDAEALSQLRVLYAAAPELAQLVSGWQEAAELEILAFSQAGISETFRVQADTLRKQLQTEGDSPIERMLINRVVLDHLHALNTEHTLQKKMQSSLTFAAAEFYQKQAERAQRRLLRSIKSLAEVRKLLRPSVQVNIAERQVNIAGDVQTGKEALV